MGYVLDTALLLLDTLHTSPLRLPVGDMQLAIQDTYLHSHIQQPTQILFDPWENKCHSASLLLSVM